MRTPALLSICLFKNVSMGLEIEGFISACKRSVVQGNIFLPVCHFVYMGCLLYWQLAPPLEGTPPWPGKPPRQIHPPKEQWMLGDTGNKQAVCILLECILVCMMGCCFDVNY